MSQDNGHLGPDALRAFPKVELHRHLEGTFAVDTLHRMALRNGLPYPEDPDEFRRQVQFPKDSEPDFLKFLSLFKNDWYASLDDVAEITAASVREFADDGIAYIELRFSPEHFAFHNGFDRADVTRAVVAAGDEAARAAGIDIRYLITFNRAKQNETEMLALYTLVKSLNLPGIVGIDLAGDETNYPPELFRNFFTTVSEEGIYGITIHAGEVSPPDQIWQSISLLKADRIGHGVAAIRDPKLQKLLSDQGIVLEQCITSNYQTGAWTDESTHPMGKLHGRGVPVTINSDDPFIQNSDLTQDYIKAVKHFGFGMQDLVDLNLRALDGAFLEAGDRDQLKSDYLGRVDAFRQAFGA